MREITSLPESVHEERVWIPMSDGIRLAARLWRPHSSDDRPVPGVMEYLPYRQRDLTAWRDSIHHPYLAGHGYACLRVDLRGTGDSDGVLLDEYLEIEQRDGEEALAWLADQPWCNGRLGMMGISWGGFNALQIAARRPEGLQAIAISSFTDDRYGDDMHYMGGALLSDNLAEAGTMFAHATLPPDPETVGDRWLEMWTERLESAGPWADNWLSHQRRDAYWRHASVREDYTDIRVPVLASSGWADGYSNTVTRLLANLDVPRRGLIGPWSHKFPHLGEPGPAIGYLQELVTWWDHWLKDIDNDALDGPMLQMWMQDSVPPSTSYEERPGRWVGEDTWPSPNVQEETFPLTPHRIADPGETAREETLTVSSPLSVGQYAGKWASYNAPPDLPYDQREEDGGSLVFDTDPLVEPVEILGSPTVQLEFSVDQPVAMVAARLSDIAPDGSATRVCYGLLNLTHRGGHENPESLEPGRRYRAEVKLNGVAQHFPAGHRIRLSLSTSYWPLAWPPPKPVMLTVSVPSSALVLPTRSPETDARVPVRDLGEPEGCEPIRMTQVTPGEHHWTVRRDLADYRSALDIVKDNGRVRFDDIDLEMAKRVTEEYGWTADDFTSVYGHTRWATTFERGDWQATTVTETHLSCTETELRLHARLDAYHGDERITSRNWTHTIVRDHL